MRLAVRKLQVEDITKLQSLVIENIDAIEPGLTVLDSRLLLGHATIDVIALDDVRGALVLVAVGFTANEEMLLNVVEAYSWCLEYPGALERLYPSCQISEECPPRLLFVVERMSDAFQRKLKQLGFPEVDCVELRHLDVDGVPAVYFESIARFRRGTIPAPAPRAPRPEPPTTPEPTRGPAVENVIAMNGPTAARATSVKLQKLLNQAVVEAPRASERPTLREPAPVVSMLSRQAASAVRVERPRPAAESIALRSAEPVTLREPEAEPVAGAALLEAVAAHEPLIITPSPVVVPRPEPVITMPEPLVLPQFEPVITMPEPVTLPEPEPMITLPEPIVLPQPEPVIITREPAMALEIEPAMTLETQPALTLETEPVAEIEPEDETAPVLALETATIAEVETEPVLALETETVADVEPEPVAAEPAPSVALGPDPAITALLESMLKTAPELESEPVSAAIEAPVETPVVAPTPAPKAEPAAERVSFKDLAAALLGPVQRPVIEPVAAVVAPATPVIEVPEAPVESIAAEPANCEMVASEMPVAEPIAQPEPTEADALTVEALLRSLAPAPVETPEPEAEAPAASTRVTLEDILAQATEQVAAAEANGAEVELEPALTVEALLASATPAPEAAPVAAAPAAPVAPEPAVSEPAKPAMALPQGFEGLNFPNDGVLTRQWMEFLSQMSSSK